MYRADFHSRGHGSGSRLKNQQESPPPAGFLQTKNMSLEISPAISEEEHQKGIDALDGLLRDKNTTVLRNVQLQRGFSAELATLELDANTMALILDLHFIGARGREDSDLDEDLNHVATLLGMCAFIRKGIHGLLES